MTYSVQFLPYLVVTAIVSGNLIGNEKGTSDKDSTYSGMIIANVLGLIAVIHCTINIDVTMKCIGVYDTKYQNWIIYSMWMMYLTIPLLEVSEILYFKHKDTEAGKICLIFNFSLLYYDKC